MEYIIYCDESSKDGKYYGNFYGGALISSKDLDKVNAILNDKKASLNMHQEVKWSKVTENYLTKYLELIELFFDLIELNIVKIRIMFTHNYIKPINLTQEQRDNEFFILYYQFFKSAFGLPYCNDSIETVNLKIFFDKLPNKEEKNQRFKDFIYSLRYNEGFSKANIIIQQENIAEVDSKKHVILQCMDIILGAMYFRLNDLHKEKPPGQKTRGKRTIAKEKLYKRINRRICMIKPNFNIGISTGKTSLRSLWEDPYRHWRFVPSDHVIDETKSKHQNK